MHIQRLRPDDAVLAQQAITMLKSNTGKRRAHWLSETYLSNFLGRDENILLVALEQNRPIGFALAYRLERIDRAQDMVLFYEIEVDKEHRGRGAGTALINALKDICREKAIMKMWVYTDKSNGAALQLYTSTGGSMNEHGDEVKFTYYFGRQEQHKEL